MASSTQEERIKAALAHVEAGFAVFSVWSTDDLGTCRCPKTRDCTAPGKHPLPTNGFKAATRDPDRVRTMLSVPSEPNYGLVWPADSPLGVVFSWDIDGPDWRDRLNDLKATFGALPTTKTTRTPHGGLHLYYRWPAGVPLPEGNMLHGFLVRWPEKGYVVGPLSRIAETEYESIAGEVIATLPDVWAATSYAGNPTQLGSTIIRVTGDDPGYEMPESVPTGTRHDAITKYVAHLWNLHHTRADTERYVRGMLAPLFNEPMDDDRLRDEIDHAWESAAKKWESPGGAMREAEPVLIQPDAADGEVIEIDPLAIEARIEAPKPPALDTMPSTLAMVLDHLTPITDAPHSSLALASVVALSALYGSRPLLRWRGTQRCSIFGALIGHSSYGRKGQAIREVMTLMRQADPMLNEITEKGIASGEVFIDTLKAHGAQPTLVVEGEMATMLTVAAREGNTTSYVLREAWDGDMLQTRSRKSGIARVTDYHLSILGATTPSELELRLSANELMNGWANRWLWFWTERRPGGFDETAANTAPVALTDALRDSIEFARTLPQITFMGRPLDGQPTMTLTPAASRYLASVREALDTPAVGTIGVLRQRMPPIAVRLAMVAALLDMTDVIEVEHLDFGFAMTDYAVESMRAVFGVRVDDPVAMLVLNVLRQVPDGWMNTSNLRKAVGGKDHSRLMSALRVLMSNGLIEREDRAGGRGRPAIGYRLVIHKRLD